jgi:DNA integrity scanning protein DisA with diadenylate cyclase activity/mannitol/fructose-specific phosphotransferase system IIA component (Ntr-type)
MRLDRHLTRSRIVDIRSKTLKGALSELLDAALRGVRPALDKEALLGELMERENSMTTYLGNGVAMPHIRVPMPRPYIFAVGRCPSGLEDEDSRDYKDVRLLFLLLACDGEQGYLNVLASLARLFRDKDLVKYMVDAGDLAELRDRVFMGFSGLVSQPVRKQDHFNTTIIQQAERVARASHSSTILLFSDTFTSPASLTAADMPKFRTVLVTRSKADRPQGALGKSATEIEVRSFSHHRLAQLRSAVLIGLTRGLFSYSDRLCCVGGIAGTNQLDTVVVIDVEKEFQSVVTREDLLPANVKNEVVERLLNIATELAVEGREGRPVGSLFVLGDTRTVNSMVKPLVLNPFYGYKEEDRNILNPFMDETIKEFSVIDGCFVIRGDGVVESAGSLIHAPSQFYEDLPSGFGARHSAAAAVTRAADCMAVVVSASNGRVTLFRHGVMMPLMEKPIGGY